MYKRKYPIDDKVIIEIEDNKFTCSRSKLCENSDYFYAMFNGDFTEKDKKSIIIQDVPQNGFRNCLNFINEDNDLEADQLLEMLHCACVLQFAEIKYYCIERFTHYLPLELSLDLWHLTEFLDIHPLCEMAKCLALINFKKIKDMKCLLQINIKQLHSYLANHLIHCDNELDIFQAGMNWWYENSDRLEESEDTTNYLYTILSCIDFKHLTKNNISHMLTYPDIKNNKEISNILIDITKLMDDSLIPLNEGIEKKVKNLYFNTKSRKREVLPCIVTSEYPWQPGQKRSKPMERKINISYYDSISKDMKLLYKDNNEFSTKCSTSLKGCKTLPYKQDIILFGGEYSYGSADWNCNIWMYHSFKTEWELITRMPKERRHFVACIIEDKLFIIGGIGKYRIKVNNIMMIYDFAEDLWTENVHVPYSSYDVRVCEFQKKLLVIPSIPGNQNGYIFDLKTLGWFKLNIEFPPNFNFDFARKFILFTKDNSIYIKGSHLIEMQIQGSVLKVVKFDNVPELQGDKINYFFNDNNLYVFSEHYAAASDLIFQLHRFNLDTEKNDLLVQINDSIDHWWHLKRGCFPFFHYSLTKDVKCISEFSI